MSDLSQRQILRLRAIASNGSQGGTGVLAEYNRLVGSDVFSGGFWGDIFGLESAGYVEPLGWKLTAKGQAAVA